MLDIALRMLTCLVCSFMIGAEREYENKNAGLRTHVLVSITSALVMIISEKIFLEFRYTTNLDPARLGAQVISGIGFIGAGAILKDGLSIKGLTTASSLWAVSGIGLACGMGYYTIAFVATLVIMIVLLFFKKVERFIVDNRIYWSIKITLTDSPGHVGRIGRIIGKYPFDIRLMTVEQEHDTKLIHLIVSLKGNAWHKKAQMIEEIMGIEGVQIVIEE